MSISVYELFESNKLITKTSVENSKTFYILKGKVKRRYSEFLSLRNLLSSKFENKIIPPLPEKHSFKEFVTNKDLVEIRTFLLEIFLQRITNDVILSEQIIVEKFLNEETSSWADVIITSSMRASSNSNFLASGGGSVIKAVTGRKLKNPDLKFVACEQYTDKFKEVMSSTEKNLKKFYRRSLDIKPVHTELGAILNASSLDESLGCGKLLESFGVLFDKLSGIDVNTGNCSLYLFYHEYYLYCSAIQEILEKRHTKHSVYEDIGDQLDSKRLTLTNLQNNSSNAGPVSSILNRINQLIDNDPVATRTANIAKLQDSISILEKQREDVYEDLLKTSEQIKADLDLFQAQKIKDLKAIQTMVFKSIYSWCNEQRILWKKLEEE